MTRTLLITLDVILILAWFLYRALRREGRTLHWVGGSGNWEDPRMWDLNIVPRPCDNVHIAARGGTVTMNSTATIRSLTVYDSGIKSSLTLGNWDPS